MRIRKAVFPVAGLGTRILPASKVIPKTMFPLVDTPILHYNVLEAVNAGIEEIIFVNSRTTRYTEDHFDPFPEWEVMLQRHEKHKELEELRLLSQMVSFASVRQAKPLGLGHAILCARELVGDEPFVVILGDDTIDPATPCLPNMIKIHEKYAGSVLSLLPVAPTEVSTYGVAVVEELEDGALRVLSLVEKPTQEEAPSNLIVTGRYILTPGIFELLEQTFPARGGEIQITDALLKQAEVGQCYALKFTGKYYDNGTALGLLRTSIAYGLRRPDIGPGLREYLRQTLEEA